jgi:hypothetical protein
VFAKATRIPLLIALFVTIGATFAGVAAAAAKAPRVSVSQRVVVVRSSTPVKVLGRRQVVFLDARSHRLHWRLLTHGYQRVHRFTVSSPVSVVRLGRRALRRRNGRWLGARIVRVDSRQPALSSPVAPVGPSAPAPTRQMQASVAPVVAQTTTQPKSPVESAPTHPVIPPATPRAPVESSLPLVSPASASAFTDSVGVNVHMSYFSTAYNNWQQVRDKLVELGVHHVRDAACVGCTAQRQRLQSLAASGIGVDYMMGAPGGTTGSLPDLVNMLAGPMRSTVDAVEGPNEYDQSGDANWIMNLRSYQQQLYSLMKGNASLASVPVIGPSLVKSSSFAALGDLSGAMDWGNMHPYAGGQLPASTLSFNSTSEISVAATKRAVATEAGYQNALNATSGQPPVSEDAAGAYIPRLVLDMFQVGVPRTYLYELLDEKPDPGLTQPESDFGLLRNDFSEKPAFRDLAALMHMAAPVGSFDAAPLHVQVDGPADLHQLLIQTSSSSYSLVLWRDVKVWDQSGRKAIDVSPADATVQLGPEVRSAELSYLNDADTPESVSNTVAEVALTGMPAVLKLSI